MYINNKHVERFVDEEVNSLSNNRDISTTNIINSPPVNTYTYVREPWEYTGYDITTSVPSAEYLQSYYDVFKAIPAAKVRSPFTSGYYWLNFGDYTVGNTSSQANSKYTYCLLDTAFDGGGWILAMRGVKNSKTFHYNSPYWTANGTLNDSAQYIADNIGYTPSNREVINEALNSKSSIGNLIYTTTDSAKYDAKFEAFDKYPAREWLVIFYIDENKKGGDYNNNRGWVWHERNLPRNSQNRPYTAREIFSGAHATGTNANGSPRSPEIQLSTQDNYGGSAQNVDVKTLKKFYKNYNTAGQLQTPLIWSLQNGYNWYGINYLHNTTLNIKEPRLMRWGMTFTAGATRSNDNRVVAGIGLNYDGVSAVPVITPSMSTYNNTNSYSAGNFIIQYAGESSNSVKYGAISNYGTLGNGEEDTSFAFEFYVR